MDKFRDFGIKVKLFIVAAFLVILGFVSYSDSNDDEDSPQLGDSLTAPSPEHHTADPNAVIEEIVVTGHFTPDEDP